METRARKRARRSKEARELDRSMGHVASLARIVHRTQGIQDQARIAMWRTGAIEDLAGYRDPALIPQMRDAGPDARYVAWTAGAHLPKILNPDGGRMTWPQYRQARDAGTLPPPLPRAARRYAWDPELAQSSAAMVRDSQAQIAARYMRQDLLRRTAEPVLQDQIVGYASALSASGRVLGRQRRARPRPKPKPKPKPAPKRKKRHSKR